MMYATQQDALLGNRIKNTAAMWLRSGPTSAREISALMVQTGLGMPTLVIHRLDLQTIMGTSVNRATPFLARSASKPVQEQVRLSSPAVMVNAIRDAFGLNVTQLAQAMQVERVTVYAWLRIDSMDKLHQSNSDRLYSLHRIAKLWQTFEPLAGGHLLEKLQPTQKSVMDMLSQDQLDPAAFTAAYEQLVKATAPTLRAMRHRAEQKAVGKKAVKALQQNIDKLGMDLS